MCLQKKVVIEEDYVDGSDSTNYSVKLWDAKNVYPRMTIMIFRINRRCVWKIKRYKDIYMPLLWEC